MYAEPNQQHYNSPKFLWEGSTSAARNAMLIDAGYSSHRTLTLRHYDQLPPEVKVDLITVYNNPLSSLHKLVDLKKTPRPVRHNNATDSQVVQVSRGFTLLEMLVVLLILGSLYGVGMQALQDAPTTAKQYEHLFTPSVLPPPYGLGALPVDPQQQGEQLFTGLQK